MAMGEDKSLEIQLGQRIQQFRKKAGLTQQQLCNTAGLSYSTLAKIERGAIKSPSVFTVQAISDCVGVKIDELVGPTQTKEAKYKTSKNGVKFVYFDLNGSLISGSMKAFSLISRDFGISLDQVETAYWYYSDEFLRGKIDLVTFNKEFAKRLGVAKLNWMDYYLEAVSTTPGVDNLIGFTRNNYHLGIISNSFKGVISELKNNAKLVATDWDQIIDSSELGILKPEKEIFNIATNKSGQKPDEILLIDDTIANLAAAEKSGWQALWFDSTRPEETIKSIYKILDPLN